MNYHLTPQGRTEYSRRTPSLDWWGGRDGGTGMDGEWTPSSGWTYTFERQRYPLPGFQTRLRVWPAGTFPRNGRRPSRWRGFLELSLGSRTSKVGESPVLRSVKAVLTWAGSVDLAKRFGEAEVLAMTVFANYHATAVYRREGLEWVPFCSTFDFYDHWEEWPAGDYYLLHPGNGNYPRGYDYRITRSGMGMVGSGVAMGEQRVDLPYWPDWRYTREWYEQQRRERMAARK